MLYDSVGSRLQTTKTFRPTYLLEAINASMSQIIMTTIKYSQNSHHQPVNEIGITAIGQGFKIQEGAANRQVISGAHWEDKYILAAYALCRDFAKDLNNDFHTTYKLEWTLTCMASYS
jgi:hypothetical protein